MTPAASPMRAKGLTPKPDAAKSWCPVHAIGASYAGWACPKCPAGAAPKVEKEVRPRVGRFGRSQETAMSDALDAAGFVNTTYRERPTWVDEKVCYRRQHPWGDQIARGFASDFAFLSSRLLLEVEGGAHVTKANHRSDAERASLAATIGYRIVKVTKDMIPTGQAVELVRKAIESAHAEGGRDA